MEKPKEWCQLIMRASHIKVACLLSNAFMSRRNLEEGTSKTHMLWTLINQSGWGQQIDKRMNKHYKQVTCLSFLVSRVITSCIPVQNCKLGMKFMLLRASKPLETQMNKKSEENIVKKNRAETHSKYESSHLTLAFMPPPSYHPPTPILCRSDRVSSFMF